MGKSTAVNLLVDLGIPAVDTDNLARRLTERGSEGLAAIAGEFGPEFLDSGGNLDRRALANLVFNDSGARLRLEGILHPRIQAAWKEAIDGWRNEGAALGAVIIPLLFEKGYAAEFFLTVAVGCTADTQRRRLRDRGWTELEIHRRRAAQLPEEEKFRLADIVVWTEGSLDLHREQWRRVLARDDVSNATLGS